ncbi:hypothetical protein JCM10908_003271 [Rhodotorula pacifica]|uniref:uncharacterized protein n=1 Tax=Rhodotorula pacifica TaxID=1495444 RepID=UPI003182AF5C
MTRNAPSDDNLPTGLRQVNLRFGIKRTGSMGHSKPVWFTLECNLDDPIWEKPPGLPTVPILRSNDTRFVPKDRHSTPAHAPAASYW